MEREQADPILGQLVAGRYRVVRQLGEGGMGQVYLAMHEAIEKEVALKILKPEYSAKEDIVTRFQQEAISASRIKHPNVLEVFDFGKVDNGCAFLAMEFLSGNDLADELVQHGYLSTKRALRILLQICRALASAHKAGVVHRDMKPDNVFLQRTADGEEIVKIVDFGIAQLRNTNEEEAKSAPTRRRLTKTGMIFGTPEYMAPEQAAGKKADQRVDVYATGIILFEMFTGAVPFTGDSFMAVLAAHLNDPVPSMLAYRPDLDISPELHAVVTRALSKNADERFMSMADFAGAVVATPEGKQLHAAGDLNPTTLPPPPPSLGSSQANPTRPQGSDDIARYGVHQGSDPELSRSSDPAFFRGSHAGVGTRPHGSDPGGAPAVTAARPETLEAQTTTGPIPGNKSSSGVGIFVGLGAAAIAAVVGWFVILPRLGPGASGEDAPALQAESVAAVTVGQSATTDPPPVKSAEPAATTLTTGTAQPEAPSVEPTAITKVIISVQTTPAGAVLEKDGFQVCDQTPCDVELEAGDAAEFVAVLGARKGSAKVLAQKDQTVTIALPAPPSPRPQPRKPPQRKMCEVMVGGLKILRECPE